MHVTNKQFSDKFNNGWEKNQNGRFIAIFLHFDLVGAITSVQRDGGGLLSSVLLLLS